MSDLEKRFYEKKLKEVSMNIEELHFNIKPYSFKKKM